VHSVLADEVHSGREIKRACIAAALWLIAGTGQFIQSPAASPTVSDRLQFRASRLFGSRSLPSASSSRRLNRVLAELVARRPRSENLLSQTAAKTQRLADFAAGTKRKRGTCNRIRKRWVTRGRLELNCPVPAINQRACSEQALLFPDPSGPRPQGRWAPFPLQLLLPAEHRRLRNCKSSKLVAGRPRVSPASGKTTLSCPCAVRQRVRPVHSTRKAAFPPSRAFSHLWSDVDR